MTIREIFDCFDKIGCCTFATINGDLPETRIAHFLTWDDEGIYFMTMNTKPFYRQLKETGKVSVCGLYADTRVLGETSLGLVFDPGYFIRLTGEVREVTVEELKEKNDPRFTYCIEDNARYPAMTAFVVYRAKGEIYDYDFEKEHRDHKLERVRFSYGGMPVEKAGLTIDAGKCIGCGRCEEICSFAAPYRTGDQYAINGNRCDECGNCFLNCPANAISHKGGEA